MRLVLLSGGLVVCLSLCIYSRYHDREGRGRNTIAKTAIANITSITILNGHRQEPWRRMQCHATGREGVRGQDKHEKRRSGDLPIVAPPIPGRRGDATLTNVSSSASGPLPSAAPVVNEGVC